MTPVMERPTALTAPNQLVEIASRTLAYRRFGSGPEMVLSMRLRGTMDMWDPLFLDSLAAHFTVTVFDYSGLGFSTGTPSYAKADMARDVDDLVTALGLGKIIIGGWSLGGFAAQVFAATHPEKVSHVLAIATMPPGLMVKLPEPLFFEVATKLKYSAADEHILFFEPASAKSRALGNASLARIAARQDVWDKPTPAETMNAAMWASNDPTTPFPDPDGRLAAFFETTDIPVLALCGDHDLVFPVENWYALNDRWPTLFVATYPECGHGPQHQYPEMAAELIASFVRRS